MAVICEPGPGAVNLARAAGEHAVIAGTLDELIGIVYRSPGEMLLVLGEAVEEIAAFQFAAALAAIRPAAGIILVREHIDVPLLQEAQRAGVRQVVPAGDFSALAGACDAAREHTRRLRDAGGHLPRRTGTPAGRIITVFAAKGGCGKTTIAVNLAMALSRTYRTCLVDLDLAFGDVAIMLQVNPGQTISDALPGAGRLDQAAAWTVLTPYQRGLNLLLAPVAPGEAERLPATLTTELLPLLQGMFDIVLIDTPSALNDHVLAALDVSAFHVLLTTPEVPALKNLRVTLDMLDMLNYPREGRRVVLNRSDSKVGLTAADVQAIVRTEITAKVPSSRAVPASVNSGKPLTVAQPRHPVSQAITALAGQLQETTVKGRRR